MTRQMAGRASANSPGKPSLYTDTSLTLHSADTQGDSILGGLEHARPRRKRLISVLGIALTSAIAIGWWQAGGFVREKDVVPVVLAAAPQADAASAVAVPPKDQIAQSDMAEGAGTSNQPGEQISATVISESDSADRMSSATQLEAPAVKPAASVQAADSVEKGAGQGRNAEETAALTPSHTASVSKDAPAIAQETKVRPVQAAASPDVAKQKTKVAADAQVATKSPANEKAKDAATGVAKASGNPGNGEAKAKHAGKDGDVELIAALLNRVSARPDPVSEDAVRKPLSSRGTARLSSGDQKKSKKAGAARESVAPTPVSAEIQLKQCGSMGFIESELCRFKVCDGRWGRDPACPEYSQASAALP